LQTAISRFKELPEAQRKGISIGMGPEINPQSLALNERKNYFI
jgi:hypothetical protein